MKNAAFGLCAILFVALSLTACHKDESFDEELSSIWSSKSVKVNSSDVSTVYTFNIDLRTDHTFTLKTVTTNPLTQQTVTNTNTGNWSTTSGEQGITLNFDNAPTQSWTISDLTKSGMNAQFIDEGGKKYEIAFVR